MAADNTLGASLDLLHTGAASHAAAQTDPTANTGSYRSSTKVGGLGISGSTPSTNLTADEVAGACGGGTAELEVEDADTVRFKAPGSSSFGASVTIANGETKQLRDGDDPSEKWLVVSRTSATDMTTGTANLTLALPEGNAIVWDDVDSTLAGTGGTRYYALAVHNASSAAVTKIKVGLAQFGTAATTSGGALGASGAGTITGGAGAFSDWPDTGYALIQTAGGTLRERVYYSSRTDTALTVPAAGRGLFGTSAAAGAVDDVVYSVSGFDFDVEAPASQTGEATSIADTSTAPGGISFGNHDIAGLGSEGVDAPDTGDGAGKLASGNWFVIWFRRVIPAGATADPDLDFAIRLTFDAA